MNELSTLRAPIFRRIFSAALTAMMVGVYGCALVGGGPKINLPPTAIVTLEYYPGQVKGYENTYPGRGIMILVPSDERTYEKKSQNDHKPLGEDPAVGVILGPDGKVVQRLYTVPFVDIVQNALMQAAAEAGMVPVKSTRSDYVAQPLQNVSYVLKTGVRRCWVEKRWNGQNREGPTWKTTAEFNLSAVVYKPPFSVPFWRGQVQVVYHDPPLDAYSAGFAGETAIYESPGEVLSVAFTRAVAGIFKNAEFHTLVMQDSLMTQ